MFHLHFTKLLRRDKIYNYYRRTYLRIINALVCVKAQIIAPMLRNLHFSYMVQNHSAVTIFTCCINECWKNITVNINFITCSKAGNRACEPKIYPSAAFHKITQQ